MKEQNHPLLSAITIGLGLMVVMIALDVIPYDPEKIHAPDWILILAGGVFIFGGLAVGFRTNELLVSVLGNLIVASFAAVAAWVALDGSSDQFSGGIPFVPHATNVKIARVMFGGGAVLCTLMLIPGIRHVLKLLRQSPYG
ncbi:MAG: hypothetical protein HKN84_00070 [Gammaproteobacteria bacterium]|nr:hypothetical protein [Gammaproteobacteria bacterium]